MRIWFTQSTMHVPCSARLEILPKPDRNRPLDLHSFFPLFQVSVRDVPISSVRIRKHLLPEPRVKFRFLTLFLGSGPWFLPSYSVQPKTTDTRGHFMKQNFRRRMLIISGCLIAAVSPAVFGALMQKQNMPECTPWLGLSGDH